MSRSQRHLREREGFDSGGNTGYPGSDYEWDWSNTWPSGKDIPLPIGRFLFQYLGTDARAPRLPVLPAAFAANGGVGPWTFDPGDGNGPLAVEDLQHINRYYYLENGTYTATLTDSEGEELTDEVVVDWIVEAPEPFSINVTPVTENGRFAIQLVSGVPVFEVNMGDGSIIPLIFREFEHVYDENGTFTIEATDGNGATASGSAIVTDLQPFPITVRASKGVEPGEWSLQIITETPNIEVDWGDGTVGPANVHTYTENGTYDVVVSEPRGGSATTQIVVNDVPPLSLSVTPVSNETFQLRMEGGAKPFDLDFGDGETAQTELDVYEHTYSAGAGQYTITATDAGGATATAPAIVVNPTGVKGPFDVYGTNMWLRDNEGAWEVGLNLDSDEQPDVWLGIAELQDLNAREKRRIRKIAKDEGWEG